MKRLIRRVRKLGDQAAQLRQTLENVPPKVAEFKEAMAMTTGQLKNLREEFESGVADLKMDNEGRLMNALQEIKESTDVFREAGFELGGVDLDMSPIQKFILHLDKIEEVSHKRLRKLIKANKNRKTTHVLLASLLRAEEMADKVDLPELHYDRLTIHVGPIPKARLSWRAEEVLIEEEIPDNPPPIPSSPATSPAGSDAAESPITSDSPYANDSFFEQRSAPEEPPAAPAPTTPVAASQATAPAPAPEKTPTHSRKEAWTKDALDRFKKMPNVSKYTR